jgi:hypothetical protein
MSILGVGLAEVTLALVVAMILYMPDVLKRLDKFDR